jgi:long-chain acyl-CoA synthetase
MTEVVPTIAGRIRDRGRDTPQDVALREKSLGIWQETTWAQYGDLVERAAHGLLALGVRPRDRIAIRCGNRPEWLVADAAAVAARALTADPNAGARVLIAEDQEHVDEALAARTTRPDLEWIVYLEPRGVREYGDPSLVWWPDLLARGAQHRADHPRLLGALAEEVRGDDPVTPTLSARDVNAALSDAALHPDAGPSDFVLCHLPLSQTASRLSTGWLNAHAGVQLHFGEPSAGLVQTLREVEPSLLLGTPATWETLRLGGEPRTSRLRARALRNRLGLRKCRSAVSVGRIAPELGDWYGRLGLTVRTVEVA